MLLHEYTAYKILESDRILLEKQLEYQAKAFENEAPPSRSSWLQMLMILVVAQYYSK